MSKVFVGFYISCLADVEEDAEGHFTIAVSEDSIKNIATGYVTPVGTTREARETSERFIAAVRDVMCRWIVAKTVNKFEDDKGQSVAAAVAKA